MSWQTVQTDAMLPFAAFQLGFRTRLGFSCQQRVKGGSALLYFANLHKTIDYDHYMEETVEYTLTPHHTHIQCTGKPTKSYSGFMFCLQMDHGLRIDRSLVY